MLRLYKHNTIHVDNFVSNACYKGVFVTVIMIKIQVIT